MAQRCVVRTQANFFCWNFLSELSTPTSPLLFTSFFLCLSLSLLLFYQSTTKAVFFSSRIIPGPASQGIIIIVEYFLEDMSPLHSPLQHGPDPGFHLDIMRERFSSSFLRVTRLEGAFVNIEHLALSLARDQTGVLRCKLKRRRRGSPALLLGRMFGTSGASLWGLGGRDVFVLQTNTLREIRADMAP